MAPLLSQIVHLIKSIVLRPEDTSRRSSAQFFPGKQLPFGRTSGIVISWWYSEDTFDTLDTVASLLIGTHSELRDCDPESVSDAVMKTLQEVCINPAIFKGDALLFSKYRTLLECRAVTVPQLAAAILQEIVTNVRSLIGKRCTIFAVPRLQVTSFCLAEESIRVIAISDSTAWQDLVNEGYQFDGWTPMHPILGPGESRTFSLPGEFECLLVAEAYGTQKGAQFNSILRFRKLAAVLFAVASERAPYPYHKAMARPLELCVQFPHKSNPDLRVTSSSCDSVFPYYASPIPIGADEVATTQDWYSRCLRCSEDTRSRLEKGAHFLNRGMNSSDIEAYINYFVTLDALFGERGSVESSILKGVRTLGIPDTYIEKAKWLFELRNEIVHGGSRYITEWPKFIRYKKHFRSNPMTDVQSLAQVSVLKAPYVFAP